MTLWLVQMMPVFGLVVLMGFIGTGLALQTGIERVRAWTRPVAMDADFRDKDKAAAANACRPGMS